MPWILYNVVMVKKMNARDLIDIDKRIQEKIGNNYDNKNKKRKPIYDGIIDVNLYLNSPTRIMWVLKEPYEKKNGDGGGWKLGEDLLDKKTRHKVILRKLPAMQVMTYITYGVFYNKLYEEMKKIRQDPEMSEVLTHIAWINLSKMPSLSYSKSYSLWNEYNIWREILLEQIENYRSDVIIFGNTFGYFRNDIVDDKIKVFSKEHIDYFLKNERLFIDAYHPNQRQIKRQIYINEIIKTINELKINKLK